MKLAAALTQRRTQEQDARTQMRRALQETETARRELELLRKRLARQIVPRVANAGAAAEIDRYASELRRRVSQGQKTLISGEVRETTARTEFLRAQTSRRILERLLEKRKQATRRMAERRAESE